MTRILYVSDNPALATGYARVAREVLSRLAGEHGCRVACLAWFHDTPGSVPVGRRVALFPSGGDYGASGFAQAVREFRPDVGVGRRELPRLDELLLVAVSARPPHLRADSISRETAFQCRKEGGPGD